MSRFNLIDEKWIPVRYLNGERDELGIRDTLLRSKEIATLEDASPLVVAALHRFLLAVLYRALEGPTDIDQAKALFRDGLSGEKITAYLEKWRDRFWLFDEKLPFGQIPTFQPKKWRAWTSLAVEYNADTAKVLFDHTSEAEPGVISPAAAIRWLFATQTFAVSTGKSEISHTGTAPSAASVIAIPIGSSLQDTLLFCLIPQNRMVMSSDVPFWERPPETLEYLKTKAKVIDQKSGELKDRTVERRASGLVDLYTWRTRSVIFKERKSGDISHLGFASGVGYQESLDCDPMLAYVIKDVPIKGSKEKTKRKFSVQLEGRELWREFDSLLPDDQQLAPKVIEHAVLLTRSERDRYPKGIMVVGQKYFPPRPNVAFWRKEHFVFPYVFSVSRSIRHEIREILISAEKSGWALNAACESYATDVLTHGERKVERKDIRNFVQQMLPVAFYWPFLEFRFHQILREYTLNHDFDDFDDIRCQWLKAVRNALHQAWEQHKTSVSMGDAWAIRALVKAEAAVLNKRRELDAEILKYEPMKETT